MDKEKVEALKDLRDINNVDIDILINMAKNIACELNALREEIRMCIDTLEKDK